MNKEKEYLLIIKDLIDIIEAYGEDEGYIPRHVSDQSNRVENWLKENNISNLLTEKS